MVPHSSGVLQKPPPYEGEKKDNVAAGTHVGLPLIHHKKDTRETQENSKGELTMRTARWMIVFAAVVGWVFALAPAAQAVVLTGPYGVVCPTGTNPSTGVAWALGDVYRLVFVTSTTRDATSTNIADYNAFVNAAADASSLPGVKDVTWYAIGSTSTVSAISNTGTTGTTGVPIYLIDATAPNLIFNVYSGSATLNNLWSSTGPWAAVALNKNESGVAVASTIVLTGTSVNDGAYFGGARPLGGATVKFGNTVFTAPNQWKWCSDDQTAPGTIHPFYAMSEPLTVTIIPEPATLSLLALGAVGMFFGRRRSRKS